jgi:nitrogen fixation/metabolism regulation signal transduction histidine kinase
VYDVFFGRNVPGQDEALVAFVGGKFHHQNVQEFPLEVLPDHALDRLRDFSRSAQSGEQLSGHFDTAKGEALFRADTGVGIPEEERERILERFARGGDAGRRYRSAGLGLAIVKTGAEAHGGRVTVESHPGEGSRFTMVLPRVAKWRES